MLSYDLKIESFMAYNNISLDDLCEHDQTTIDDITLHQIFDYKIFNFGELTLPFNVLDDEEIKNKFDKLKEDSTFSIEEHDSYFYISKKSFDDMGLDFTSGGSRFGMF